MKFGGIHFLRLLIGVLVAGMVRALTSPARAEDTQWVKLNGAPQASTGVEVDASTERVTTGGATTAYDHWFITPTVGLRTQGSIYHPDLLSFDLNGELGWGWDHMKVSGGGANQSVNESEDLKRYLAQFTLLAAKPYNATLYATQDHTFRDYGSFDTFTVDSSRYGGHLGWDVATFNLNAELGYRNEKDAGLNDSSELTEKFFNFTGIQRRKWGQTTLTYRLDNFDNVLNSGSQVSTLNQSVGISDAETFGPRREITAATGVGYSQSEYGGQRTETVNGNENINANLRPNLDGFLLVNSSRTHFDPIDSDNTLGSVGLRHQLYESLVSRGDVHGSYSDATSPSGSSANRRLGVGLSENYTKRIPSWGRLTAGAGIIADHESDHSDGGILTIFDEPHQIYLPTSPNYHPVYLNEPEINAASIQVSVGGLPLTAGTDYLIVPSGQLTEIRLVTPPSATVAPLLQGPDSDYLTVTVTYQYTALNNASFDSLNNSAQIRLDLFSHFGIYGRVNWMDNNAPPEVLTQTLLDLVAGADYNWRWFRTGAEYENYDSNFSQYEAWRFFQDFSFQPDAISSLSVNFNETFYRYPGDRNMEQYQSLARYNARLLSSLAWFVEGGASWQDTLGTEQLLGSARTGVTWTRGKLSLRTGYEFNGQNVSSGAWNQDRMKQRIYFYLKRTF